MRVDADSGLFNNLRAVRKDDGTVIPLVRWADTGTGEVCVIQGDSAGWPLDDDNNLPGVIEVVLRDIPFRIAPADDLSQTLAETA